jgi:hypothetical protein
MFVARDKESGLYYKRKTRYYHRQELTDDINEARIYKSVGGLKSSLNICRKKIDKYGKFCGWDFHFPENIEIVPLCIQPKETEC